MNADHRMVTKNRAVRFPRRHALGHRLFVERKQIVQFLMSETGFAAEQFKQGIVGHGSVELEDLCPVTSENTRALHNHTDEWKSKTSRFFPILEQNVDQSSVSRRRWMSPASSSRAARHSASVSSSSQRHSRLPGATLPRKRSRPSRVISPSAKLALSGRRKIVKLAVGGKFANFLKQVHQRLEVWLRHTAPQLSLSMGKPPPWLLFDPTQAASSAVT
jgi:hypothetical protein